MSKYSKRIDIEFNLVKNKFSNTDKIINKDNIIFKTCINKYLITCILSLKKCFYPFKKPIVLINNKKYFNFLESIVNDKEYYNIVKIDNKSHSCIYCNSILCKWYPYKKIIDILDEVVNNLNIFNRLNERNIAKYISLYFNLPCIIHEYL